LRQFDIPGFQSLLRGERRTGFLPVFRSTPVENSVLPPSVPRLRVRRRRRLKRLHRTRRKMDLLHHVESPPRFSPRRPAHGRPPR
jgi:hypothetical protein